MTELLTSLSNHNGYFANLYEVNGTFKTCLRAMFNGNTRNWIKHETMDQAMKWYNSNKAMTPAKL